MSNELLETSGAEDIQWESFTSAKGNRYEVGHSKGASPTDATEGKIGSKTDFGISVNWPVGAAGIWVQTTPSIASTTAITAYSLYDQNGASYKYILYFSNTKTYNYKFFDGTGDSYGVNTFSTGYHYVRYNSDNPAIGWITGS